MDTKLLCTQKIHSIKKQNEFTGSDCTFINNVPYLINDDVGYIKFNVSEDSSLEDYLKFD